MQQAQVRPEDVQQVTPVAGEAGLFRKPQLLDFEIPIAEIVPEEMPQRFAGFVDVSFRGPGGVKADLNADNPFREFLGNEGKEEHTPAVGRALFLATGGQLQSIDLDKHGLFTKILVDGLKGAADKEGYEPDGVVTVDELTQYIDKELPDLAHKQGKTKDEKGQQHFVLGGRASHFVLTHNPSVAAKVVKTFGAEFDKLKVQFGYLNNKRLEPAEILTLADLPSLEALRSKFLGVLNAPATKLVVLLNTPATQLARVLQAKAGKGENVEAVKS